MISMESFLQSLFHMLRRNLLFIISAVLRLGVSLSLQGHCTWCMSFLFPANAYQRLMAALIGFDVNEQGCVSGTGNRGEIVIQN